MSTTMDATYFSVVLQRCPPCGSDDIDILSDRTLVAEGVDNIYWTQETWGMVRCHACTHSTRRCRNRAEAIAVWNAQERTDTDDELPF